MRVVRFPWLVHREGNQNFEVYSVSVSPNGKRLASGGLDGKIRIWDVDTLKKYDQLTRQQEKLGLDAVELDQEECRDLCSMGRHTGAVTCLKFSPNGRFLASGSDDRILLIWERDDETSRMLERNRVLRKATGESSIGTAGMEKSELEHWTVRKRLVAHDNDIQDMAWAPDSSILVSVGLDRSIIVWSGTTFEKIKRFDIHQSHVKGVVFDPAGKYFATCSDDRTLRIFRYRRSSPTEMSFSVEYVVTTPFKSTPLTTYYRRCSWSPDGQYIASPNAVNGGLSSVAIIQRGSWESNVSLLGHDLPCEVCSFSPRIYEVTKQTKKSKELTTVLVTGGQDRAFVLWDTASSVPLAVARDFCFKTITDVSWDPSGQLVFISSLDGSVTAVFFEDHELGRAIPIEQNASQLHRFGADRESMYFPESVEQLQLEEKASKIVQTTDHAQKRMETLMGGGVTGFNKTESTTGPVVNMLVARSKKHPDRKMPALQKVKETPKEAPMIHTLQPRSKKLSAKTQKVEITKSGKKRVAPMLVSGTAQVAKTPVIATPKKRVNSFASSPSIKLPRLGLQTMASGIRDNLVYETVTDLDLQNDIDHIAELQAQTKRQKPSRSIYSRRRRVTELPSYMQSSVVSPFTVFTDMRMQPCVILGSKASDESLDAVFEIRNDPDDEMTEDEFDSISRLFVTSGKTKEPLFQFFKNTKVTNVTESKFTRQDGAIIDYWAISTDTGSILLLTNTGRQFMPSIELGVGLTHLISKDRYLLAVTNSGLVSSWDLLERKSIMENVSLAPLINQFATFDSHRHKFDNPTQVNQLHMLKGIPLLVLSNDQVYSFDTKLYNWINVLDPWYTDRLDTETLRSILKFKSTLLRVTSNRLINSSREKKVEHVAEIKRDLESTQMCILDTVDS